MSRGKVSLKCLCKEFTELDILPCDAAERSELEKCMWESETQMVLIAMRLDEITM